MSLTHLAREHLPQFVGLAADNPDGWGMAWREGAHGPQVERSLTSAKDDPKFGDFCARALGDLGIVHLRSATPPLEVSFRNSHPFVRDGLAMAHNGAIFPKEQALKDITGQGGWPQQLDAIIPNGSRRRPEGETDSERYFLAVLTYMDLGCGPVDAMRRAVEHILAEFRPSCLNALLLTEESLFATSWHQPEPYPDEYYRLFSPDTLLTYFDLQYRLDRRGLVVASTGWTPDGWQTVTEGHVLEVARFSLELTEHDLFSDRSVRVPSPTRGWQLNVC
jgi:predicted glutamine amidotransferase